MSNGTNPIVIANFNLASAERFLCEKALEHAGSIVEAARLLGITRHALKRRIIKLRIEWPRVIAPCVLAQLEWDTPRPGRRSRGKDRP